MQEIIKNILSNKVKCKFCGDIIESKNSQEYVKCSCGKVVIGGGLKTLLRLCKTEDFEELSNIRLGVRIYGYENYERVKGVYSLCDAQKERTFRCPKCNSSQISIIKGDGEKIIGCDIIGLICDNCEKVYEFKGIKYKKGYHNE